MLFLLSGEGPTDIGMTVAGEGGEFFTVGPLALVVDSMIERVIGYSPLGLGYFKHISRSELARIAKNSTSKPAIIIPGVKRPAGNAGDYRQAFALASKALELEGEEGDAVTVVLFRDSDGTNSDDPRKWENLISAIEAAFNAVGLRRGVAMIAKPKQEAWFMCALKEHAYQACGALEDESGNDNSPNSLKAQMQVALGANCDTETLIQWIENGGFDHARVDMPSFNRFRESLTRALAVT